jgi:hypothetical protein
VLTKKPLKSSVNHRSAHSVHCSFVTLLILLMTLFYYAFAFTTLFPQTLAPGHHTKHVQYLAGRLTHTACLRVGGVIPSLWMGILQHPENYDCPKSHGQSSSTGGLCINPACLIPEPSPHHGSPMH